MATSYLLVHSPLLGPSSWGRVADVLEERGHAVQVPDLRGIADVAPPRWRTYVDLAVAGAEGLDGEVVVVGHSGAGACLPSIGARLGARLGALVFVDAVVPARQGAHEAPARLRALLDEQTVDGILRPWLSWWPDEVVAELLPDPADREALAAGSPQLPRDLYDEPIPVPDGWSDDLPAVYLRLSDAYAQEWEEAAARGWPRAELYADHLTTITQPARVVDAIVALA